MTLNQAKEMQVRINKLDKLMNDAIDNPNAWKRTLGCPGSRYLPAWEELHEKLTRFLANGKKIDVEAFCDWVESQQEVLA